jgi:hypothetical protein
MGPMHTVHDSKLYNLKLYTFCQAIVINSYSLIHTFPFLSHTNAPTHKTPSLFECDELTCLLVSQFICRCPFESPVPSRRVKKMSIVKKAFFKFSEGLARSTAHKLAAAGEEPENIIGHHSFLIVHVCLRNLQVLSSRMS